MTSERTRLRMILFATEATKRTETRAPSPLIWTTTASGLCWWKEDYSAAGGQEASTGRQKLAEHSELGRRLNGQVLCLQTDSFVFDARLGQKR